VRERGELPEEEEGMEEERGEKKKMGMRGRERGERNNYL
jgi:hypothetical protein